MVTMTVREALNQALAEEMRRDEKVFLMGKKLRNIKEPIRLVKVCWKNSGNGALLIPQLQNMVLLDWLLVQHLEGYVLLSSL